LSTNTAENKFVLSRRNV